jgi:hypothetical protein
MGRVGRGFLSGLFVFNLRILAIFFTKDDFGAKYRKDFAFYVSG